jgi:hypothetical protein|tara:strand:+ start:563 stop:757 length:195 start_codon:yes stop_codon:yes gene_type:complete
MPPREKIFHIYLKDECIFANIKEEDFNITWNTLNGIVGLMKTDYELGDLSYEELTVSEYKEASY